MGIQDIGKKLMSIGFATTGISLVMNMMRGSRCCHGSGMMGSSIFPFAQGGRMSAGNMYLGINNGQFSAGTSYYSGGYGIDQMMGGYYSGYNNLTDISAYSAYAEGKTIADDILLKVKSAIVKNEKADAVEKDYDTTKGQAFEDAGETLEKEGGEFVISKQEGEDYKKDVVSHGKSYLAFIDKKFGDSDGYLTKKEWLKFQSDDSTAGEETEALSNNMFKTLDQNKDGTLDYKEMSSMFYAMDHNGKKETPLDGVISHADYVDALDKMTDDISLDKFQAKLERGYNTLFSKKTEEEEE